MKSDHTQGSLGALQRAWVDGGPTLVARRLLGRVQRYRRTVRRRLRPTALEIMMESPWSVLRTANDVVGLLHSTGRWPGTSREHIHSVMREGRNVLRAVASTLPVDGQKNDSFTPIFDVEPEAAVLLYAMCRLDRPDHVLETGVARGMSTALILSALKDNEAGQLTSVDVTDQVGSLVPDSLRDRWSLVKISEVSPLTDLELILRDLPPISMFLHDSDHRPEHQRREYALVKRFSREDATFFSDDVEASGVFTSVYGDFRCLALAGDRKCLGLAIGR